MTFLENLNWRYATRKFSGKVLVESVINQLIESSRLAPSSFGTQPYFLTVVKNKGILNDLLPFAKNNESQIRTCSHLFVFSSRMDVKICFQEMEAKRGINRKFIIYLSYAYQYFCSLTNYILFRRFVSKKMWTAEQVYLSVGFLLASCAELKVDSIPMEGFNSKGFKKVLKLDTNLCPTLIVAVGERAMDDKIFPKVRWELDKFVKKIY